jgi:hypothetical protein
MGRSGLGVEINAHFGPLIAKRLEEHWEVPDWRDLDILHSSTMVTGMSKPRKIQWHRRRKGADSFLDLFSSAEVAE